MTKTRLEAYSDAVIAIIITIMVLELKVPQEHEWADLKPLFPVFGTYVMSFVYISIYWNNHHHLMHAVTKVDGRVLWANAHLLFWLSLIPFTSSWMGEHMLALVPVICYCIVMTMNGVAYYLLSLQLIRVNGKDSPLARAVGRETKGIISLCIYLVAIGLAFVDTRISLALLALVAVIWFIPDRRIERKLEH